MAVRDVIVRLFGDDKDLTAKLDKADRRMSEFARSNPTATLKADDTNASRILDSMKVKLTEYGKMTETARLKIDDAQALYTLDKLDLKMMLAKKRMDSLGKNMDLGGLTRLRTEMDAIGRSVDHLGGGGGGSSRGGFLSRLAGHLFGLGGSGGGGGGLSNLAGGGARSGGSSLGSNALSSLGGASNSFTGGAIGVLLAILGSIAPAVLPFAIGGGIGLGGAALAGSLGASGAQKLAADKYALARAQAALSGSKTGGSPSQHLALQHAQQQLAHDRGLYGGFAPFGKAVTGVGHSALGDLLSAFTSRPHHMAMGPGHPHEVVTGQSFLGGLTGILGQVGGFIKTLGPGLGEMFRASLPFVKAFVTIMEQFAKAVMPALTQMMKQFTPYLPQMVQGFKFLTDGIVGFMKALGPGMKNAATVFKAVMAAVKGILIALGYTFTGLAYAFAHFGHNVKTGVTQIIHFFRQMWHDVVGGAMNGWHHLKALEQQGLHDIAHVFDTIRHTVSSIWDNVWITIGRIEVQGIGKAVSLFRGLPGRIVSALGNMGRLLYQAGRNVIQGLINGITSMFGAVGSAVSGIVSNIRNFLPFSPAKKGPLSGSGSPDIAGRKIGEMLASGMDRSASVVSASANRMAQNISLGGHYISAGGPAGFAGRTGPIQLVVSGQGDDLVKAIVKSLRYEIRNNGGGNVQGHLGWGSV